MGERTDEHGIVNSDVTSELAPLLWQQADLQMCFALTRRLQRLVDAACGGPFLVVRWTGDRHFLQGLWVGIQGTLSNRLDLLEWARAFVPNYLPDAGEIDEFGWAIVSDMARAEAKVRQLAVPRQRYHDETRIAGRFVAVDRALDVMEMQSRAANETFWKGMLTSQEGGAPIAPTAIGGGARRGGRPKVAIPPDRFAAIYWRMWEELREEEQERDPTRAEVCQRLKALGEPVCSNTMRQILRDAGIGWPPPRPLEDAA